MGIFEIAALGVDPFQSLMSGLNQLIPISFGTLYVIINVILLSFNLLTDRKNIGIALFLLGKGDWKSIPTFVGVGTIMTAFFMGPLIQFFNDKLAEPFLNRK